MLRNIKIDMMMFLRYTLLAFVWICSMTNVFSQNQSCPNLDFSNGWQSWVGYYGKVSDNSWFQGIIDTENYPFPAGHNQTDKHPRHLILNSTEYDAETLYLNSGNPVSQYIGEMPTGLNQVLKLGNAYPQYHRESLEISFLVSIDQPYFGYHFASVLQTPTGHGNGVPYFELYFYDENNDKIGSGKGISATQKKYAGNGSSLTYGFEKLNEYLIYLPWSVDYVDLSAYAGTTVKLKIISTDCSAGGHFGYSFFSGFCSNSAVFNVESCIGSNTIDLGDALDNFGGDPVTTTYENIDQIDYTDDVLTYNVNLNQPTGKITMTDGYKTIVIMIHAIVCEDENYECPKFYLQPNQKYNLTYWIKEDNSSVNQISDASGILNVEFISDLHSNFNKSFTFSNLLPNQWTRFEHSFITPDYTTDMRLRIINNNDNNIYMDDLRIVPENANAVSYVYDPETRRLIAELDGNNYPSFYEYDKEGNLIRIKKEAETGTHTIKESRQETIKIRP